ncbi:sugar ABC transporter substrate-binding protein [Streptomyces sp. AJS327]|uniref:substrate-binding domain-containing protein n=1 Tax=Streptomyces sp. AJS327 TaxID=2545265 RepID=UPI0015DFFE15|nr:substrate-binding domain-containing protein [Streptomyces sp. AJS327]MBA0052048.1 sugar ABC transporter substrate-binding protein [Streptomyces sp. AJS327]
MHTRTRRAVIGTAAISLALTLGACGKAGGGDDDGDDKTIGLLLPENKTTRYESFDKPLIEKKIKALCSDCTVKYNNASESSDTQKKQFDGMVAQGVKVIILDAVDAESVRSWVDRAAKKDVQVVAYDRLAEGDISAYVSYDNYKIGQLQGKAMLEALGDRAKESELVMLNGSPTDPNAPLYKRGAHSVLDKKIKGVVYEQDVPNWEPEQANKKMKAAITKLGDDGFDGAYIANDGMAGGALTAMRKAGVTDVPVGGQDAELAGLQRIVQGQQAYTIYKAIKPEAETTAEIAVRLLQDKKIDDLVPRTVDSQSKKKVPAQLYSAKIVTKDNIKDTVIKDKVYTVEQICTKQYAKACADAGIK